jgi:outer membrane lipoprotein-sorting protein
MGGLVTKMQPVSLNKAKYMKRIFLLLLMMSIFMIGCTTTKDYANHTSVLTEEDVRNAVTELINGINSGNMETVQRYVGDAAPIAEKLIDQLKGNIKLHNVRDISIQGTTAKATVTLEVVPLNVEKDITLSFNVTDVLFLNNPLGLLAILLRG